MLRKIYDAILIVCLLVLGNLPVICLLLFLIFFYYLFVESLLVKYVIEHYQFYSFFDYYSIFILPIVSLFFSLLAFKLINIALEESSFKFKFFLIVSTFLTGGLFSILNFINEDLNYLAYRKSLEHFEQKYMVGFLLSKDDLIKLKSHPDYIRLIQNKDDLFLSTEQRHSYVKELKDISDQLEFRNVYEKTYNSSYEPRYFLDTSTANEFFSNYSNVKDDELSSILVEMKKYSVVKTTDYIKFNSLYKHKFITESRK